MEILKVTPYVRNGMWHLDALVIENGKKQRLRFSSGFQSDESEDMKKTSLYLFLAENGQMLTKLYIKGELKSKKDKLKRKFQSFKARENLSFKAQALQFLDSLDTNLKASSKNTIIAKLRPSLSFFEWHLISEIDKEQIEKFFDFLDSKELNTSIKKQYAKALNRVLKFALENETIAKNPFKMRAWRNETKEIQAFSESEIQLLLKEAKGDIGLYLKIGLLCGARTGEILALQWKHIDFHQRKIIIEQSVNEHCGISTCKTKSSHRVITCLSPLLEALKEARAKRKPKDEDFIFKPPLKDYIKSFHRSFLKTQYIALLERLDIAYRPIYNTRHSFASLMLSKGENIMWVSWMMGHSNTQTTLSFYSKFLPNEQERAEFLKDFIGGGK